MEFKRKSLDRNFRKKIIKRLHRSMRMLAENLPDYLAYWA